VSNVALHIAERSRRWRSHDSVSRYEAATEDGVFVLAINQLIGTRLSAQSEGLVIATLSLGGCSTDCMKHGWFIDWIGIGRIDHGIKVFDPIKRDRFIVVPIQVSWITGDIPVIVEVSSAADVIGAVVIEQRRSALCGKDAVDGPALQHLSKAIFSGQII